MMGNPTEQFHTNQDSINQVVSQPVNVASIGMITPVGADVQQTVMAIQAGISRYNDSSFMNKNNKPVTMALVPEEALPALDVELQKKQKLRTRQQRLLRLASPAIQQAYLKLKTEKPIPLLVGGPQKVDGKRSPMSDEFLKNLMLQSKVPLDLENSYVFPKGRSAGIFALEAGMLLLERGLQQVMVGAVDTYLDSNLLSLLDQEDRLLAENVMDGFAPGEAAVFMVLTKLTDSTTIKLHPPGISSEQGHRYSEKTYMGDGLANAVRDAIEKSSSGQIRTVLSSMNGENFGGKEWGVCYIRNNKNIDENHVHIHPADCIGDTGAASGLIQTILAIHGIGTGKLQKPALVWSSSDYHQRAALVVS